MTEQEAINQLQSEGFNNVRVVKFSPKQDLGKHTHEQLTGHIILEGELFTTDEDGNNTYEKGDRVDISAGTTHSASVGTEGAVMVLGEK